MHLSVPVCVFGVFVAGYKDEFTDTKMDESRGLLCDLDLGGLSSGYV